MKSFKVVAFVTSLLLCGTLSISQPVRIYDYPIVASASSNLSYTYEVKSEPDGSNFGGIYIDTDDYTRVDLTLSNGVAGATTSGEVGYWNSLSQSWVSKYDSWEAKKFNSDGTLTIKGIRVPANMKDVQIIITYYADWSSGKENQLDKSTLKVSSLKEGLQETTTTTTTTPTPTTTTQITTTTTPTPTTTTKITTITTPIPTTTNTTTTTIEEPSVTTGEDKSIIFGEDNWGFVNSSPPFYNGNYYISDTYFNILTSKLDNTEYFEVEKLRKSPWGGSCYGLATISLLVKSGVLDTTMYPFNVPTLNSVDNPNHDDIESIINYYMLSQCSSEKWHLQDYYMRKDEKEKLSELEELLSQVSVGGNPVLLCFKYSPPTEDGWGHAVDAYGVETFKKSYHGKNYDKRILIYDNTQRGFSDNFCLYYNSISGDWCIPGWNLESSNYGKISLISNDVDFFNNNGYFDITSNNDYTMENIPKYVHISCDGFNSDYSITSVKLSDNGSFVDNAPNNDDIEIYYGSSIISFNNSNEDKLYPPFDASSSHIYDNFKVTLDTLDTINMNIMYPNDLLLVNATNSKSVVYSSDGAIYLNADESEYNMEVISNDGYYTLPWYDISVSGQKADVVNLEKTDDGFILYSDNLNDITVNASTRTYNTGVNFSTMENMVLIYAIDDYNIGIAIDQDGDGTFETDNPIAQTSHTGDLNNNNQIDATDILLMKKSILGISNLSGDLNNDNNTNVLDLIILKTML